MTIYEFASILNDCELIVFKIFDCNSENCVFVTDDEDDTREEFNQIWNCALLERPRIVN